MRWKEELGFIIRRLIHRRRAEQELDEEIRAHLEMEVEQNIADGMSPEEARLAARRSFGSVAIAKEDSRAMWGLGALEIFWQDLRYGARMLLKRPGFTAIAIITLALGIGANTVIFSVANALLLRPLPLKDADRLVDVQNYIPSSPRTFWFSYPDYVELRKETGAVVDMFAASRAGLVLGASTPRNRVIREVKNKTVVGSDAEQLNGHLVSGTYFSTLGGKAMLGRTLTPEDDQAPGAHPVVVLSHRFWQQRFGADPDIVGRTIPINGSVLTVVGVAEAGFAGVYRRRPPDVWIPLLMRDQLKPQEDFLLIEGQRDPENNLLTRREAFWLEVRGRLQPGVSLRQAESAMTLSFRQLKPELKQGRPDYTPDQRIRLYTTSSVPMDQRETVTRLISIALGAVTLVLLIACLNVAGLMLARLATRQREIAVRLSLGASRLRLLRQLFTESLLLAAAGGLAGLLLSRWMTQAWRPMAEEGIALDWRVMAYTLGISVFTAVVIGLTPAWQTTRFDLIPALKQEGTGFKLRAPRFPLRSALVVGQIALSLVLLIGAGLFARTLLSVGMVGPGFETKDLSVAAFGFEDQGYDETSAAQFQRVLQERLLATPLVKEAVWVWRAPLIWDDPFEGDARDDRYYPDDGSASLVNLNGRPAIQAREPGNVAASNIVAPNYFAALGVPLLYGRTFTEMDTRDERAVVIVNEALARRHWPGENPVGKSLLIFDRKWEIIGVAKNTRNTLRHTANRPFLYLPINEGHLDLRLLVKSDAAPAALASTLQATIQSLDPQLRIEVRQIRHRLEEAFGSLMTGTSAASLAGVLALALAVMGLYGVMAFVVVQRTREIGVRMALGAQATDVVRLVLREGLLLVIIGVALGLMISVAATRVLAAALYGISPTDPLSFGAVTLLLGLVAMLACWVPARRATKVDPLVALRCE